MRPTWLGDCERMSKRVQGPGNGYRKEMEVNSTIPEGGCRFDVNDCLFPATHWINEFRHTNIVITKGSLV
jgi:hypothetical protein